MSRVNALAGAALIAAMCTALAAQAPPTPARQPAPSPWRFAGPQPCAGPEGGILQCPPAAKPSPSVPADCSTASRARC